DRNSSPPPSTRSAIFARWLADAPSTSRLMAEFHPKPRHSSPAPEQTYWSQVPLCSRAANPTPIAPIFRRFATQPRWLAARLLDDPALFPAGDGRNLVTRNPLPHLVRDRGARCRCDGRTWHDSEGSREESLGQRQGCQVRHRTDRYDRARG